MILGHRGWFGQTLIAQIGPHQSVMAVGSPRDSPAVQWREELVQDFQPTVVANFAFLLPHRLREMSRETYEEQNRELTRRFLFCSSLDSVRMAVTVSSGAVVVSRCGDSSNPTTIYGNLKANEEEHAMALVSPKRSIVVARAYSVSGPYVRRIHDYAFSDLVFQSMKGSMRIRTPKLLYRRYVSVADFLSVAFCSAKLGWSGVIESGGPLVEIGDLALVIRKATNPAAEISRPSLLSGERDFYASDNSSWAEACIRTRIEPMKLLDQVRSVERYLRDNEGPAFVGTCVRGDHPR